MNNSLRTVYALVYAELIAAFPVVTPENIEEAKTYRDERIEHWRNYFLAA